MNEHDRESNGSREFYPGNQGGFDERHERTARGGTRYGPGREGQSNEVQRREGQDQYRGHHHWGQPQPRSERIPWNERGWGNRTQARESFPRDSYGRQHSSEQLFDREPFGHFEDTRYYGTGSVGYTGGAYAYGDGPRDQLRPIEDEFSDESAVSYERGDRQPPGYRGRGYDYYGGRPGLDRTGVNARFGQRVGYGGVGGSAAEQRAYPRGPKGYQRSDERLKEDICERLWAAYHIDSSEVTVEVKAGKVSLEGSVPNRYMKHSIEDIVDSTPGVVDIDNRVRVGTAVTTQSAAPKR